MRQPSRKIDGKTTDASVTNLRMCRYTYDIRHILSTYPHDNTPSTAINPRISIEFMCFDSMLKFSKITAVAMSLEQNHNIILMDLLAHILDLRVTLARIRMEQSTCVPGKNPKAGKELPELITPATGRYQSGERRVQAVHQRGPTGRLVECPAVAQHWVPPGSCEVHVWWVP